MRVYCVQMDPFLGDIEGNRQKILKKIEEAKGEKADVVVFPELALCGYLPGDLLLFESFIEQMESALDSICEQCQGIVVILGTVLRNAIEGQKPLYNSAVMIENGKITGRYHKCLLPNYDVFRERRYFARGKESLVWRILGKNVGILICEDMWSQEESGYSYDPVTALSKKSLDLVINISASPYSYHKEDKRIEVCQKAAGQLNCPLLYMCQVGGHDELLFDGRSMLFNREGEMALQMRSCGEEARLIDPFLTYSKVEHKPDTMRDLKEALVMGLEDYCKKSGFKSVVIGLSGGIDSAVVAALAQKALGKENVLGVSMPSKFTSTQCQKDADMLAKSLGIQFKEIEIQPLVDAFTKALAPVFEGCSQDVTEENIQARVRGIILMAISNKKNKLLLATGNKSELAVGYCTLYGDMCGGIAPIGDVYKTKVYELAHELNRDEEVICQSIIDRVPSAELSADQKDIDLLPAYEVLDVVLEMYIEQHESMEKMKQHINEFLRNSPQYAWKHFAKDESTLVEEIVSLVNRNEYKRRQAAHSLRVTEKSFSQGRYFPINKPWPIFHLPQENTTELLKQFPGIEEYLEK